MFPVGSSKEHQRGSAHVPLDSRLLTKIFKPPQIRTCSPQRPRRALLDTNQWLFVSVVVARMISIRALALLGLASAVFAVPAARSETGHKSRQGSRTPRSRTVIVCPRFFPVHRSWLDRSRAQSALGARRDRRACDCKCRTCWWLRAARAPAAAVRRLQAGSLSSLLRRV